MRDVAIIGIGHTKFGRSEKKTNIELQNEAAMMAILDAGIDKKDIEAVFQGAVFPGFEEGQVMPGIFSNSDLGLSPVPCTRFEGACASATVAARDAFMYVASGRYDIVMACGTERALVMGTPYATRTFAMGGHSTSETPVGMTFPGVFAMAARLYSRNYDIPFDRTLECMAHVSIKNHKHGALNPKSQFYKKLGNLTVDDVRNSRMICDPLTLLDCCPFSDGAAAIILCAADIARKYTDTPVYMLGNGQGAGGPLARIEDITKPPSRIYSAREAFKMAGLSPDDIEILELHDCFTSAELIALECMGFFDWGEAAEATAEGQTEIGGKIPTNMDGGLIGKGHPVGATGVAQIVSVVEQMRGDAPKGNQVDPVPEYGMTDTLGGDFGTLVHHILGRSKRRK